MADDDEKKVMDVAKPGESKPEMGSKPMVIGHRSMATDPTLRQDDEKKPEAGKEEKEAIKTPTKKVVLVPLTDNDKDEGKKADKVDKEPDATVDSDTDAEEELDKAETKNDSSVEPEPKKESAEPAAESTEEAKTAEPEKTEDPEEVPAPTDEQIAVNKDKADLEAEEAKIAQEARLRELVKKKEYFVPIKEHNGSSTKTFMFTFIFVVLLGIFALLLLIDAEVLDVGVELPFDLIKK